MQHFSDVSLIQLFNRFLRTQPPLYTLHQAMSNEQPEERPPTNDSDSDSESIRRPRPRSIKSWRSLTFNRSQTRSTTRSRSPDDTVLRQVFSGGFHDDHSIYRNEHEVEQTTGASTPREDGFDGRSPVAHDGSGVDAEPEVEEEKGHEEVESRDHEYEKEDRAGSQADLEKAPSIRRQQTNKSSRSLRDPDMVSWNGPDDPENPKNWTLKRKWVATFVVSSFTFISPVASSMVAPALPQMAQDLHVYNTVEAQMMLSIFLLAYAFGPLFLGPLSELYGRVHVLQLANLVFLVFNLACGFAQNGTQMIVSNIPS
jgi:hypothetical protein